MPDPRDVYITDGAAYYAYQARMGRINGVLNAPKFAPYILESDRVLDLGCGGGALLSHLPGHHKVGVEINPVAADDARRRGLEVVHDLSQLAGHEVDVAISNHALEHMPDPLATLRALRTVLRPGGLLVMRLPIEDWRRQRRIPFEEADHHLFGWTPRLMANLLRAADFLPVDGRVVNSTIPPMADRLLRTPTLLVAASKVWSMVRRRREFAITALRC